MDFDKKIERRQSGSIKWNRYSEDIIPLWVADMDFEAAKPIQDALKGYLETKVYGYAAPTEELASVIIERFEKLYHWKLERDWIVWTPSVVSSIFISALVPSKDSYHVMTSIPVYHPFLLAAEANERKLQAIPLKGENFQMDFDAMKAAANENTKLYILCNPHNPTGRMYTKEELEELSAFCAENGILVCSDEIHADIILDKSRKHIPFASISEEAAMNSISLYSSGKAFNTPGINAGFAVIPNPVLRDKFLKVKDHLLPNMNKLGADITLAAYKESAEWLENALAYIRGNYTYVLNEINAIEGLSMSKIEGTYLAWVDYSALGVENFATVLEQFGVGVIEGSVFKGEKHFRLNLGTQRELLEEAISRIKKAVNSLR